MTSSELKRLETIIFKIEELQTRTADNDAKYRLQSAKSELIRLSQEALRRAR